MNILGIGRALASRQVTNAELTSFLDTSNEWISSRTGIQERRVLGEEGLFDLALHAAQEALLDAKIQGSELDLILVATTQGDYLFPSLACQLQKAIGASCPAMDLHAACSGFLYSLQTAWAFLDSGKARRILVIGAEAISRLADWTDRATCVLFGDGAGAVVLGPEPGFLSLHLSATSDQNLVLYQPAPKGNCPYTTKPQDEARTLTMKGQDVFRYAVGQSEKDLLAAMDKAGVSLEELDYVLLHQANLRIIDAIRRRFDIPPHKLPSNIHRTGNTSAASIPLLLWELYHAGYLLPGSKLAFSAFGAGLTSGACVLKWTKEAPQEAIPAPDLFRLSGQA